MKKILLFSALFTGFYSFSQQFSLISQDEQGVTIGHELKQLPFNHVTIDGQQYISFNGSHKVLTMQNGAPALPLFHTTIQLPATGNTVIVVEYDRITEIENVSVAPSKGNLKRNVNPSDIPFSFGEVYNQNAFYPSNVAALKDPFVWRTTRGQTITLSPYQYNPVTKVLRIHENLRVRVVYQSSVQGLNEIQPAIAADRVMGKAQKQFYLNAVSEKYTPIEEEGEMLVIADAAFSDAIQPLVNWKIEKGIKTTLVTTAATGTTDTDIKAYIQNFYNAHPDLIYVLFVGDHAEIPAHTYGLTSDNEQLWSDSYYGQLAGGASDFFPEVFVGRFPGNNAQIKTMVSRTLEYEKNPAAGNWMEKAIGLGSNEGQGIGDDNEPDWQHLRNIRSRLMEYGYTDVYEFYDGSHGGNDASGAPNSSVILPAVNSGVGLFNYTGHGDQFTCITGNFSTTNVNQATNNGFYPLVISVACNNGTFTTGTCISEAWMRSDNADAPAGAIGVAGSSILMAWAQPMQTQDEMTEIIVEEYADNRKETIGGLFYNAQVSMLEEYSGTDGKEVMQTWIFFGDPSVLFRNKQTMNLTVTHTSQVPLGTTSLVVNGNTDGAVVAITQDHVLLGKGIITGGTVTITFDALTSDLPLVVTATKQNYGASQTPVQVGNGPLGLDELSASITVYPNPASGELTIAASNGMLEKAELFTLTGQSAGAYSLVENGTLKMNVSGIAAGSYLVRISTPKGIVMKHIEIIR